MQKIYTDLSARISSLLDDSKFIVYVYGSREEGPLGGGMRVVVYNKEAGPPGRYFEQHVSGPLVLFVGDGEVLIN